MKKIIYSLLILLAGHAAQAQLPGGTYTINSGSPTAGTNYISFTDAVNAMSAGISGPVIFNVVAGSGPYNEQVVIPSITGSSATNSVTFNGNAASLTYAGTTSARTTLKLDDADYITINNLNITASGPTFGYGIQLMNNADYNIINSCTINCTGTSLNFCGIAINGNATISYVGNSLCDSNVISNNTVNNGYYGITVVGDAASRISGNKITGNTVLNAYYTGILAMGNNNMLIEGNEMSRSVLTSLGSYYGIYLGAGNLNTLVSKNKVHNFFGGLTGSSAYSVYGFYTQSVASAGNENIFSNNIVYNMDGDGTLYGIYNSAASYTSYYHNTVCIDNTGAVSGNTYGFYQTGAAGNITLANNIFSITRGGTGTKACIYMNTTGTTFTANNNNYYMSSLSGTNMTGRINGTNYTTLATWQAASSQDALSVGILPLFTAPATGNLLPNSSALDNRGQPLAGQPTDITGATRSTTTPDIGAYEFSAPVISISGTTALCSGTTTTLTGTPAGGTWSGSNAAIATISTAGVVTAVAAGTTIVSYTTAIGTATATITVTNTPVVAPITGGASQLCVGASTTFLNTTAGGTWSSSNQFRATINGATGDLNAIGPGQLTITYSVANGSCISNATATLDVGTATPATISGTTTVCEGATTMLSANNPGGTWSSSNISVATVNSTTGLVTGISGGGATISYITTLGCTLTSGVFMTVNPGPPTPAPLTGNTNLCVGGTTVLSTTSAGGLFVSANTAVATVNTAGLVTGITVGTSVISYYIYASSGSGCFKAVSATVNVIAGPAAPNAITGGDSVCAGGTLSLNNTTTGGVWSSTDTTIATINPGTGVVTAKNAGATTIAYTVTGGSCTSSATKTVRVLALPVPVITLSGNILSTGTYPTYSWLLNGAAIPGANSQSYTATANGNYTVTVTGANGCLGVSAITAVNSVGVYAVPNADNIHIFPNPANNQLFIESKDKVQVRINSFDGQMIYNKRTEPSKNASIDLKSYPSGLYFIRFLDEKGTLTKTEKLTISH